MSAFENVSCNSSINDDTPCTPSATNMDGDYFRRPEPAVPWPENVYVIFQRGSNRVLTLVDDQVCLREYPDGVKPEIRWKCVNGRGFRGLYNPRADRYIGHDGNMAGYIKASAKNLKQWEMLVIIAHPNGGYHILSPYLSMFGDCMKTLGVADDGVHLTRTDAGEDTWDFVLVKDLEEPK